jgi:hypothetical protein
MPRAYGRFTTSIWLDPDFTALTLEQQGAYFTLGLQPDVTAAGVLPYTSRRWSKLSAGTTRADFEKLVTLLVESDGEHLVVDDPQVHQVGHGLGEHTEAFEGRARRG